MKFYSLDSVTVYKILGKKDSWQGKNLARFSARSGVWTKILARSWYCSNIFVRGEVACRPGLAWRGLASRAIV